MNMARETGSSGVQVTIDAELTYKEPFNLL